MQLFMHAHPTHDDEMKNVGPSHLMAAQFCKPDAYAAKIVCVEEAKGRLCCQMFTAYDHVPEDLV